MTKTTNYQLPQWEVGDPVRREDFNRAMERIDEGLTTAGYAVGTYTGTGTWMENGGQFIPLAFTPRFVIVTRGWTSPNGPSSTFMAVGTVGNADADNYIRVESGGFRVGLHGTNPYKLNTEDTDYSYVAFQ